jgi:hypothetical protein
MIQFEYLSYHGAPAPIIPIELKGQNGWERILAYVDSGAAYSLFSFEMAVSLGLPIDRSQFITMIVGDGNHIPVHLLKVPVRLASKEFEATIGFSKKLGVGFNLLGRKDFFEKFTVCFSDKNQLFSLTEE